MQKTEKQKEALLKVNLEKRLSTEQFIEKAKAIHGDKFDYSITEYVNARVKLKIICPLHGVREMLPHHHTKGRGCQKCGTDAINRKRLFSQEEFLEKVKDIKGLTFEKTIYKDKRKKVIVSCIIHGDYETTAEVLLKGCGCPKCKSSSGEDVIEKILTNERIYFVHQKIFPDCKLERQLRFDFFLPDYNMCIEYDGEQHFKCVDYWGGEKAFKKLQLSDQIKTEYCKANNIELLRISYKDDIFSVLQDKIIKQKI